MNKSSAPKPPDPQWWSVSSLRHLASVGLSCGLLLWSVTALFLRVVDARHWPPPSSMEEARTWRLGSAPVEEWARFLEAVGQRVPLHTRILVDAPTLDPADEFFLSMWCAYYLPRHDVVRRLNLPPGEMLPRYRLMSRGGAAYLADAIAAPEATHRDSGAINQADVVLLEGPGLLLLMSGSAQGYR